MRRQATKTQILYPVYPVYPRKFDKPGQKKLRFHSVHVSEYLPVGESFPVYLLARALHIDRKQVINLINRGEIKCAVDLRIPGVSRSTIRVPRAAVIEFLEKRRIVIVPDGKTNH